MNIDAIEKINFKTVYSDRTLTHLRVMMKQDNLCIGTKHYQGLAYFHNYEYRHLLRSLSAYKEWEYNKNTKWVNKSKRSKKPWNKLYKKIHDSFLKANLETDGFSIEHTKIIETVLGFKEGYLVKTYHEGRVK